MSPLIQQTVHMAALQEQDDIYNKQAVTSPGSKMINNTILTILYALIALLHITKTRPCNIQGFYEFSVGNF